MSATTPPAPRLPADNGDHTFPLRERLRTFNVSLFFAQVRSWVWDIGAKCLLGIIYFLLISEGMRLLFPPFGLKLHKAPLVGEFAGLAAFPKLDLAHLLAIFLMIGVFHAWRTLLQLWLGGNEAVDRHGWNEEAHNSFIVVMAAVLTSVDAFLFYSAVVAFSWKGMTFSATALLATAAYVAVLVFVTYVSLNLSRHVEAIRKEVSRP